MIQLSFQSLKLIFWKHSIANEYDNGSLVLRVVSVTCAFQKQWCMPASAGWSGGLCGSDSLLPPPLSILKVSIVKT